VTKLKALYDALDETEKSSFKSLVLPDNKPKEDGI
jgi:hypothetical protein